jgi:hypothetical protein
MYRLLNLICALFLVTGCGGALLDPELGGLAPLERSVPNSQDESPVLGDGRGGFELSPVVIGSESDSASAQVVTYSGVSN